MIETKNIVLTNEQIEKLNYLLKKVSLFSTYKTVEQDQSELEKELESIKEKIKEIFNCDTIEQMNEMIIKATEY